MQNNLANTLGKVKSLNVIRKITYCIQSVYTSFHVDMQTIKYISPMVTEIIMRCKS